MPLDDEGAPPTATHALCHVLRVGDDAHRFYTARALGRIAAVEAVPALIDALHDPDPDVRSAVAEALGELEDPAAVAPLLENLVGDPIGDVKINVVVALGRLRDTRAVQLLRELVRGRGEKVVWDEEEFLTGGWDDWLDVQLKAIDALALIGASEATSDIVAAMDDPDGQDLSENGARALSQLGPSGIAGLGQYLERPAARIRRSALRFLAEDGSDDSLLHLRRALGDQSPEVRLIAVRALGRANTHDPDLGRCLSDPNAAVRAEAVRLYDGMDPHAPDAPLDDPDDAVQEAAIQRLGTAGSPHPTDLLRRLRVKLRGPSERVAVAAAAKLAEISPEIARFDLAEQATDRRCPTALRCAAIDALGVLATPAVVDTITDALADDERRVRMASVFVLGRLAPSSPRAREALLALLHRSGTETKEETVEARSPTDTPVIPDEAADNAAAWPTSTLAALTPAKAAVPPQPEESMRLTEEDLEYLELVDRRTRRKHVPLEPAVARDVDIGRVAARVAGDVVDARIVAALAQCLSDADAELRRNAADSLARVAEKDPEQLAAIADTVMSAIKNEKDSEVRCLLVRALGAGRTSATGALLRSLLSDTDSFVRSQAIRSLTQIGCVGETVEACLADVDPSVRLAAADAIATDPSPARIEKLIAQAFAFDGEQRHEIGRLLRQVAPDEATAALISILMDGARRRQWRIAIETMQETRRRFAVRGLDQS